MTVCIEC